MDRIHPDDSDNITLALIVAKEECQCFKGQTRILSFHDRHDGKGIVHNNYTILIHAAKRVLLEAKSL